MNDFWAGIVSIGTAIIGVALVAVLVSRNANTAGVLGTAAGGFSQALSAAEAPVTGGGFGGFGGGGSMLSLNGFGGGYANSGMYGGL